MDREPYYEDESCYEYETAQLLKTAMLRCRIKKRLNEFRQLDSKQDPGAQIANNLTQTVVTTTK